jgi:DNA-binding IclR family transcriptional regulator
MSSDDGGRDDPGQDGIPAYRVPALEKGLDILECLARERTPLTQARIARVLDRGPSELFRTLTTLERRGYLRRDPASGAYELTLRLYEMGHAHSPHDGLLRAAARPMRELTEAVRESCHLSVTHRGGCLVIHQEESPLRVRLSVEVGSTIPLHQAASGRVLLAMLDPDDEAAALAVIRERRGGNLSCRLEAIRGRGYDEAHGETTGGVSDLSVPIGTDRGRVRGAVAVAALPRDHAAFVRATLPPLRACAAAIARGAGLVGAREEG